jgi:Tfp pilus assembly protein PilP
MMNYKNAIKFLISAAAIAAAMSLVALTVDAQNKGEARDQAPARKSGRDPFTKYQPVVKVQKSAPAKKEPPSIQVRIEAYRAQKAAAAAAHIAAPKPTTALMLSEVQVTGIFRTPRGWSAMVEAMPLSPKLSYVIYPGENFFDGQLVAIEEGRLVFRRDILWTDGKREKMVEIKPLRQSNPVEAMTPAKPTADASAETKADAAKPETTKPEVAKPTPEKQ